MPWLKVDFYKHDGSSQLTVIFFHTGLRAILEENDYIYLDTVSRLYFAYADTFLGLPDDTSLTHIYFLYTSVINQLCLPTTPHFGVLKLWITCLHTLKSPRRRSGACFGHLVNNTSANGSSTFWTVCHIMTYQRLII